MQINCIVALEEFPLHKSTKMNIVKYKERSLEEFSCSYTLLPSDRFRLRAQAKQLVNSLDTFDAFQQL